MRKLCFKLALVSFLIVFTTSSNTLQAQKSQLTQEEFKKQFIEALDTKQVDTATNLIQQNQHKVGGVIADLLRLYLEKDLAGNSAEAQQEISKSMQIAKTYLELFQKDYFLKKVKLYANWTTEQKQKKVRADSLRKASGKNFNQHKLEAALEKVQAALEIYIQIGDREDEARCLNSIGLNYFRLTDFPKAESHLKQSIEINREIGLLRGVIANLDNLAAVYKARYKYDLALQAFEEAIKIAEELANEESRAQQWKSIGTIYQAMGKYEKAFEYYNKALKFAEKTNNDDLKATTLLNLGAASSDKSDFNKAVEDWEEGLGLAVKLKNRQLQGSFLSNLSVAYRNLSQYDKALNTLKRALKLTRETLNRWTEGNTLREIGVVLYFKGLPDSSLAYWNKSIEVFKGIPDMAMVGTVTGHIGVYYKNVGKPFEALQAYKKALKLVREINNEREEANILANIGNVYNDILSDYPMAERNYNNALEIKERIGETSFIGIIHGILGVLKKNQGDYQTSLNEYQRALKIAQQSGDRSGEAKLYGNIGAVYSDLGENEQAFQFLNKCLDITEKIGEKLKKAEVLINLGAVHAEMGEDSLALDYYERANKLATEQGERDFLITIQLNTGSLYKDQDKFEEAMQAYESALQISREISAHADEGRTLTLIGNLNEELKQFTTAMKNYEDALTIFRRINSPEGLWKALFGLGSVLEKQEKKEEALARYAAAIDTIESLRSKLTIESLKESFMEEKIEVYQAIIKLLLDLGREEEAFDYMERAKARNLLDILSTDRINLAEGITPELLQKKKKVEWLLKRVNELLSREYSKQAVERDSQYVATLEDSLKRVRFMHGEVLQEIKFNHPRYAQATGLTSPLSLQEIQRRVLKDGVRLVSYLASEEELIVWVVSRENLWYERIEISEKELSALVDSLLHPFHEIRTKGGVYNLADVVFDLKLSRFLYQKIFQPIEKYLPEKTHIIIVPDGRLHYLPFEALVTDIEKRHFPRSVFFSRYETAHYLIEKYAISYAHSASVLDPKLKRKKNAKRMTGKLFAIGNPDFGNSSNGQQEEKADTQHSIRHIRNAYLSTLRNSQSEVEIIGNLLKPSTVLTGAEANENTFKRLSSKFNILHLSTHAKADATQPMYSWIAFAQRNDPDEDGFLHAYEVLNLVLNADLVTLSACETGLGRLRQGEGLIGLTRAFMYAGAPSILVSLWSVDDESTTTLMKYFYENLKKGKTKVEALQQAKLAMLQTREHGMSFAMPYLWAPFVLVGEWK